MPRLLAVVAVRDEREEAEARLGRCRREHVARAVDELEPHLGLLEPVLLRERRDHASRSAPTNSSSGPAMPGVQMCATT